MNRPGPALVVVTGIQAAGKTSVARALAQRFERGVHVEADALQRMIVSGGVWPAAPGPVTGEAARQLDLRLTNLCLLGRAYYEAGFAVVLDDIIIGPRWTRLRHLLGDLPLRLIVLAPRLDIVSARDRSRPKRTLGAAWAGYLDAELRRTMTGVGDWLDTSDLRVDQTVDAIVDLLNRPG